jgi:hypothetical protein
MRYCFLIFFGILLFACNRRKDDDQTKLNEEYLDKEIAARISILSKDSVFSNEIDTIRKNITNLQLLTIDIENINAAIIKSNQYFVESSLRYGVDTSGFAMLFKGVPVYDMVNIIKKNELSLLNKIIIKQNKNGGLMFTAQ